MNNLPIVLSFTEIIVLLVSGASVLSRNVELFPLSGFLPGDFVTLRCYFLVLSFCQLLVKTKHIHINIYIYIYSTTLLGMAPDSSPCSIHLNLEVPGDRLNMGRLEQSFVL